LSLHDGPDRREDVSDPRFEEAVMQYALLIYEDETFWQSTRPEQMGQMMDGYRRFGEEVGERIKGGEALQPTATATTVRVRDGERLLTDGPFAETREQLGGFYIVEAGSLDEALGYAAKIPGAATGCVEVRPVMTFDESGQPADAAAVQGAS
jgi:hypothetical protein